MTAAEVADRAAGVAGHGDPDAGEIAVAMGIALYAVPARRLHGCRAQYVRVGEQPVIHVDEDLCGEDLAFTVGHELAHHLVWLWGVDVVGDAEEAFCDAIANHWLTARRRRSPQLGSV